MRKQEVSFGERGLRPGPVELPEEFVPENPFTGS
jgi:hypothetical protein